ncbi:MAG: zf-TFIIB domain-containing protein [Actinomycetales bacterium]|nr:zf-TFIIB domain-containing protein [Actinomycetales bacterium]
MTEFLCPKCRSTMRTYNRNGVSIEQCDSCRGIFLDYGELEALSRVESQFHAPPPAAAPPPAYGAHQPGWGAPHGYYGHHKPHGFMRMLFSS